MMKQLKSLGRGELEGKSILLRVDFNIPVSFSAGVSGAKIVTILEDFRIKAIKESVNYLLENNAKVALVSHIETTEDFISITDQIGEVLGHTLTLVPLTELDSIPDLFKVCPIVLLENIRQDKREIENDEEFARSLSKGFDFFVNDAFSVCHRDHALVSAITRFLPSYGGFQMEKEIENLSKVVNEPAEGKIVVLGGAKISTKLPTIQNFLDKSEKILIGGALANDFLKYQGIEVGKSVIEKESLNVLSGLYEGGGLNKKIILPEDFATGEGEKFEGLEIQETGDIEKGSAILDIGPKTIEKFSEIIRGAKMVVWNGPMGLFEINEFASGTKAIAKAVSSAKNSIIGGGDTILAVEKLGLLEKFSFISTGGGAMLDFLAGKKLPGLEALGYYE